MDLTALREHIGTGPSDDVLTDLLDAAIEDLENRYGPDADTCREHLRPFGQWVKLGRRAESIETVLEGTTELDPADFETWPGGRFLRRLDSSSNPRSWTDWVDVTYAPQSETAARDRVVLALVKHDLGNKPGLVGITVGPWSEQYAVDSANDYAATRTAILASLRSRMAGTW